MEQWEKWGKCGWICRISTLLCLLGVSFPRPPLLLFEEFQLYFFELHGALFDMRDTSYETGRCVGEYMITTYHPPVTPNIIFVMLRDTTKSN